MASRKNVRPNVKTHLTKSNRHFTFIDLFAGLGGFHLAMEKLGGKCVFACEIQEDLRELYEKNFSMECKGDINAIDIKGDIPKHDVLCAGFPCQPFSKAGKQQGFEDEKDRGNLFWKIKKILDEKHPEYILLENVQNLETHDDGNTWNVIKGELEKDYYIASNVLSPHQFEIPQHRKRFYIAGRLKSKGTLDNFEFPHTEKKVCNINSIIVEKDEDYMSLRKQTRKHLEAWQHFLDLLSDNDIDIPSFPIWAMEFGATYDYERTPPTKQTAKMLRGKKGKFGTELKGNSVHDMRRDLPIYAQTEKFDANGEFPVWKKNFIKWNREFYDKNKALLSNWLEEIQGEGFENSHQKFEWNCGMDKNAKPILEDKIIQFRPSGIRVKLPTYSPALVLTTTQIPIFPWITPPGTNQKGRYMTVREAAKLQSMEKLKIPDTMTISRAFRAFGNAVNVEVVYRIAKNLLEVE